MNLVHAKDGIDISLEEGSIHVLCIEQQKLLTDLLMDLWQQVEGGTGEWILSEKDKVLDLAKKMEFIVNPFSADCNNTRIQSKVFKGLQQTANERFFMETGELNHVISVYLEQLLSGVDYPLEFDLELDVGALLKGYHVRFAMDSDTLPERLVEYIKVQRRIMNKSIVVFYNLKQLLSAEELQLFYQDMRNEKMLCLLIEGQDWPKEEHERKHIIDMDRCIIDVEGS